MTLTPAERAALERLRRKEAGEKITAIYICPRESATKGQRIAYATVQQTKDRAVLASALLRLCPADDAFPVDEGWLRSVGFEPWDAVEHYDEYEHRAYDLCIPMRDELGWKCKLAYVANGFYAVRMHSDERLGCSESVELLGTRNMKPAVTRGDVRHLCAALGVRLKEKTDGHWSVTKYEVSDAQRG